MSSGIWLPKARSRHHAPPSCFKVKFPRKKMARRAGLRPGLRSTASASEPFGTWEKVITLRSSRRSLRLTCAKPSASIIRASPNATPRSEFLSATEKHSFTRIRYRGQKSELRAQSSEVRGQRLEVRGQRSEVRGQKQRADL